MRGLRHTFLYIKVKEHRFYGCSTFHRIILGSMVDTSMFSLTLCYAGLTFDGQQFYQYQQKTAITTNHRTQNTTTYGFGNPLLGLGLTQKMWRS
jgi:hypothetical protein